MPLRDRREKALFTNSASAGPFVRAELTTRSRHRRRQQPRPRPTFAAAAAAADTWASTVTTAYCQHRCALSHTGAVSQCRTCAAESEMCGPVDARPAGRDR